MVLRDVVPVEATFLEHCHGDVMMFKEVEQLVILVVVYLVGEGVHVEGDTPKDVAVQLACQAATGWMERFRCSGGGVCGAVWDIGFRWEGGGRLWVRRGVWSGWSCLNLIEVWNMVINLGGPLVLGRRQGGLECLHG